MKIFGNFLLMFVCCLCSCSSSDDGGGTSSSALFEIADNDLVQNFEKDASTASIQVKTDLKADQWNVKSNADWCVAAKSLNGKNVNIAVDGSEEPVVRTATVSVTSSIKNYEIKVSQLGYGPAILLKSIPNLTQTIAAEGGEVEIVVTTNVDYKVSAPGVDWIKEIAGAKSSRGFVDYTHKYEVEKNPNFGSRSSSITFSDNRKEVNDNEKAEPVVLEMKQEALSGKPSDVEVEGDFKLNVTGGQANQEQSGTNNEFKYSYDGKMDTHYHSPWGANTKWPVILEYNFDGSKGLDYIIYHSRNGNGNFGQFKLYVATKENGNYEFVSEHDLKGAGGSTRIDLTSTVQNVTKVKFEVLSGSGDGTGNYYASCAEMEFYQKNTEKTLDKQLLTVFTDLTCSELKTGVSDDAINALPPYFGKLAVAIRDNGYSDYEKEFRIQEYKPYSVEADWAQTLMVKRYSSLDNPTGITVKQGDEIILLVGDTYGNKLSVRNVGEETTTFGEDKEYPQTEAIGTEYFLQEGVNKITVDKTGMLFIIYQTDLSSSNAKPIKVHIPLDCGKVNGYWCKEKHQTNDKFTELIDKSDYKYFCVRGNNIIFFFHRDKMKTAVNGNIVSAIDLWDDIVGWQHELMGLEDIRPTRWNNHLFAISPEGSYMWASDYRVAFVYTYLNNVLVKDNVMVAKDNAWGPAHEIGHIHQKTINWPSCSESSNNLFSNYILYKLGKYCSRGWTLDYLAKCRFVNNDAWYNMGDATHQSESTEIHLRMHWQLWNYYHRCGHKKDFWPEMFKYLRQEGNRIVESNPGEGQMKFVKAACKVTNQDLTDFFEMWGFFEPVNNVAYSQYGDWTYNVTQTMIDETKAYIAQFPKNKAAFYYLEDRKYGDVGLGVDSYDDKDDDPGNVGYYTQFEGEGQKITKTISHTRNGQTIKIMNGDEAVAFELYKGDKLVYFSTKFEFTVPSEIAVDDNVVVKAVQANGERFEVQ